MIFLPNSLASSEKAPGPSKVIHRDTGNQSRTNLLCVLHSVDIAITSTTPKMTEQIGVKSPRHIRADGMAHMLTRTFAGPSAW